MEEDKKGNNIQAEKKDLQPHLKENDNLIEKQVDQTRIEGGQHFVQFQPSAPPQPRIVQVNMFVFSSSLAQNGHRNTILNMQHRLSQTDHYKDSTWTMSTLKVINIIILFI